MGRTLVSVTSCGLVICMIASLTVRPPRRLRVQWALGLILGGGGALIFGLAMLLNHWPRTALLAIFTAGILAGCLGTWLGRGGWGDDGGGGGGEEDPRPDPRPEPGDGLDLDWGDFDGHRQDWEHDRAPQPLRR